MSSRSMSPQGQKADSKRQDRKQERGKRDDSDCHKVFLTNLNGDVGEKEVEDEVKRLFEKYGQVTKLSLKKHKNGYYYFGFLQFPKGFDASESVKALDQYSLFGKNMKARQDRQSEGCFYCKRSGHFARECPQNSANLRRRSYSNDRRSRDRYDRKRDDRHDRSDRRQRDRDYRDKDRYERSDRRDRDRDRDDDRERDRHRNEKRRHRQRSHSDSKSKSSSESSHRRNDRKDKQRKQKRRRSRS